jgi:hypothetical protein
LLEQISTVIGAALSGGVFLTLSHIRNTYLEAQLKTALESGFNYSTATFDEFQVMIKNSTAVPVTIREIRLRKAQVNQNSGHLIRLQYRGPSYYVANNDPDEKEGDLFPHGQDLPYHLKAKMGVLQPDEKYEIHLSPVPGDFHTLAPETGAFYALPFGACKQFLSENIVECLIIVEYPTILGRSKVIAISASEKTIEFIQKTLRNLVPMMEKQSKEMFEEKAGENAPRPTA